MPFVIGIHKAVLGKFTEPIGDSVVFVDVDFDSVNTPYDDYQLLPKDLLAPLKAGVTRLITTVEPRPCYPTTAGTITRPGNLTF